MAYFDTTLDQLPELDQASAAHAEKVRQYLLEQVHQHDGFIGFDRYMQLVLYAPGLGYYSAGSRKFGASGDYITAPMISPLFSETIANFIARHQQPGDEILELGAGTGVMASDIISSLRANDQQPLAYRILEPSADLRQRQQQTLLPVNDGNAPELCWIDHLDARQSFNGFILGNEVIDAMPVRRFVLQSGEVQELGVGLDAGDIGLKIRPADEQFAGQVRAALPLATDAYTDGYCGELLPSVDGWVKALDQYMGTGMVILLDYGYERAEYYRPDRVGGTIRGYFRHFLVTDPLVYPGMMDLTASVDFTRLAEAAVSHGFQVAAYTSQANFLIEQGLLEIGQAKMARQTLSDKQRLQSAEAIKLLTDPGEMGESIKVMVLTRGRELQDGFMKDLRYRL
jgi:SAM-dependent MidA family methyltransferase